MAELSGRQASYCILCRICCIYLLSDLVLLWSCFTLILFYSDLVLLWYLDSLWFTFFKFVYSNKLWFTCFTLVSQNLILHNFVSHIFILYPTDRLLLLCVLSICLLYIAFYLGFICLTALWFPSFIKSCFTLITDVIRFTFIYRSARTARTRVHMTIAITTQPTRAWARAPGVGRDPGSGITRWWRAGGERRSTAVWRRRRRPGDSGRSPQTAETVSTPATAPTRVRSPQNTGIAGSSPICRRRPHRSNLNHPVISIYDYRSMRTITSSHSRPIPGLTWISSMAQVIIHYKHLILAFWPRLKNLFILNKIYWTVLWGNIHYEQLILTA